MNMDRHFSELLSESKTSAIKGELMFLVLHKNILDSIMSSLEYSCIKALAENGNEEAIQIVSSREAELKSIVNRINSNMAMRQMIDIGGGIRNFPRGLKTKTGSDKDNK